MWHGILLLASLLVDTAAVGTPANRNPIIASDSTFVRTPVAIIVANVVADATSASPTIAVADASRARTTSWSSHFAFARHGIFVRVALDGADAGWFLLDTGAGATVVDVRIAQSRRLHAIGEETVEGTAGTKRATIYELGDVSVNGATAIAVTGVAEDLTRFPSPDGQPLGGILGSDFLGAFSVRIDFATHEVTFSGEAADSSSSGRTRVHFDVDHGAPRIPVMLDGHVDAVFRVDTGLHGTYDEAAYLAVTDSVWIGLARTHGRQLTTGAVSVRGLGDGDVTVPSIRIDRMAIGGATLESPWIIPQVRRGYFARADAVSLLGNGVLEHFSPVTIDYLTGTLYLTSAP